jgi:hypothetical protein
VVILILPVTSVPQLPRVETELLIPGNSQSVVRSDLPATDYRPGAETFDLTTSAVDNCFRHAKQRLSETLTECVRRHVESYTSANDAEDEFDAEWQKIRQHLAECGGLENAVRRAYEILNPITEDRRDGVGLRQATAKLTSIIRSRTT